MEDTKQPLLTLKKSKAKLISLIVLIILLVVAGGIGLYYWQHTKVNSLNIKVSNLQSQLISKSTSTSKSSTSSNTFTYSPKTGGLSLVLSKNYEVIVNVDGNKGGAPGATFRVASAVNSNVSSDSSYEGVQVDVDHTFTTLDHAVESEESELSDPNRNGTIFNRNFKVSEAKVGGLPAKLLTADGLDEYQGELSVYLVGSGEFTYTIMANGMQFDSSDLLSAVLNGMSIKPVTL